jgi:hypothetical protein
VKISEIRVIRDYRKMKSLIINHQSSIINRFGLDAGGAWGVKRGAWNYTLYAVR